MRGVAQSWKKTLCVKGSWGWHCRYLTSVMDSIHWKVLAVLLNRVNGSHRVNEFFARVNEISVHNFLYPFGTCICLVFLTQNISAIVNTMENVKRSKFASSGFSILSLQKNCTLVQLTAYITWWGRFHQESPCFVQSSGGISAVLSARASCTHVQSFSARIAVGLLLKVSGTWTWTLISAVLSVEVQA